MKKIIIVSPHFPPSNLAAVHRSRLFAQHLPSFGWEPIIVTVDPKYYEEQLDWDLDKLVSPQLRVERTAALGTKPIRAIGDIGIRGFFPMLKRIKKICKNEKIDFIYITIPSHFAALLGRLVYQSTGIPYGLDYIDPWVHQWPGTEKKFSKHWWSMKLGQWLEPIAVKKVKLITGVAPGYFKEVLDRNPHLKNHTITAAMPYGGEVKDHLLLNTLEDKNTLFGKIKGKLDFVYAGAMLPKAFKPLVEVMKVIAENKIQFEDTRIHFIGSGTSPNDPQGYNIREMAIKYDLWETVFFEYPKRIPYLDVLRNLNTADGVFILGSTEPHYTPSKVYQGVLARKPIFAILHQQSSATTVINQTQTGIVLDFNGEYDTKKIYDEFITKWSSFLSFLNSYNPNTIDTNAFEQYSAKNVTASLVHALEQSLKENTAE